MREENKKFIQNLLEENKIVLFMKGTKEMPQCGFSASVASILDEFDVEYCDINVLDSDICNGELRQDIKEFTDWPTIPQLYVNGEFIGGSDVVRELYQDDELKDILLASR